MPGCYKTQGVVMQLQGKTCGQLSPCRDLGAGSWELGALCRKFRRIRMHLWVMSREEVG